MFHVQVIDVLLFLGGQILTNTVDADQIAAEGAVWSGSSLLAI